MTGEGACHSIADIRAWRGHTAGLYGLPHYPSDPPMVTNNKGWWRDVDALLTVVDDLREQVRLLRLAMEETADFACFNENRVGDPCACCEYVTDRVNDALGGGHSGGEGS